MTRYLPLLLLLLAGGVGAGDSDWLAKASQAVREINYTGTLVYLRQGRMDTLRIVHRYRDGRERERLISLTGKPREVIRDDDGVTCVLPHKQVVLLADHRPRNLLSNVLSMSAEALEKNYRVRDLGTRRLADRMCRAIAIEPRDEYRYGYRLLIDQETHLPLKLDLLRGGDVLEQLMFTDIAFPDQIPDSALAPTFSTKGFRRIQHQPMDEAALDSSTSWQVSDLPPGFALADAGVRRVGGDVQARQLLFTDGIATVSAFIATGLSERDFAGKYAMGAVNAFGRQVDGHQITVVGEVPQATVRFIAEHLRNSESATAASAP